MSPLFLLLRLHARAFVRRLFRNASSPKGVVLSVVGALMIVFWFGSAFGSMLLSRRSATPNISAVVANVPAILLAVCLLTLLGQAGGRAVTFTAAEADHLFPAPFARWQLLLYRMARTGLGALFAALFVGMGLRNYSVSWLGTYVACVLLLLFLQTFTTLAALAGQIVGQRLSGARVRVALGAVLAGVAVVAYFTTPEPTAVTRPSDLQPVIDTLIRLRDSTIVRAMSAPFLPFAFALTAPTWAALAGWTLASAGVVVATVLITLRLDADFLESSAERSLQLHQQVQDAKRRGGVAYRPTSAKGRLASFPRLGGAGPVAWRQSLTALRAVRFLLVLFVLLILVAPALLAGKKVNPVGPLIAIGGFLTFMGGALFRFDYRADVDRLESLKALPVSPLALTLGQLATPVILLLGLQWLVCAMIAFHRPEVAHLALAAAAFAPLLSLLFTAIENLAFLFFPHRAAVAPGDLAAIARNTLVALAKFAGLAFAAGLSLGLGLLVHYLTRSLALSLIAAWILAALTCSAVIPLLTWAFTRLDTTADRSPNS